jgi:general secretion pathway protein F
MNYFYKAKQGPTKVVDGVIEADNQNAAISKIMEQGLTPLEVSEYSSQKETKKESTGTLPLMRKVKVQDSDLVDFTRQINDLLDASVPMLRALQIVLNQTRNVALKKVIEGLFKYVQDGGSFSDALAQYPEVFSPLYVSIVKTGEVGGNLEKILSRLADHLEKTQETRRRIKSSLAYPALILSVGILTIFVLLTFVIPNLTIMFEDLDQALPLPTTILIAISSFFARVWWLLLGLVVVVCVYFNRWIKSEGGKKRADSLTIKIPFLGEFVRTYEIGLFARTLGTLIESGVAITAALRAVCGTISNSVLRDEVQIVAEEVKNGSSLKNALSKGSFSSEMLVNMVSVGEETGRLDRSLYKVADAFERKSDATVKTIISLLGPIVLILVVSLVGFVVIAMMLPIFQMNLLIQ